MPLGTCCAGWHFLKMPHMYESDEGSPRLKVRDLERLAEQHRTRLLAEGYDLSPVRGESRRLAGNFWARAWMRNLSLCEAWGMNLAPGRTLLRHGCVLHAEIREGRIYALVAGAEVYEVRVSIAPPGEERVAALVASCRGKIDSLVSLLEGKLSESVLACLCDSSSGLLPAPDEWRMDCSCPDWGEPCAHAAAAIYAAGVLLDASPEALFLLRSFQAERLLQDAAGLSPEGVYDAASLSSVFGVEIELPE